MQASRDSEMTTCGGRVTKLALVTEMVKRVLCSPVGRGTSWSLADIARQIEGEWNVHVDFGSISSALELLESDGANGISSILSLGNNGPGVGERFWRAMPFHTGVPAATPETKSEPEQPKTKPPITMIVAPMYRGTKVLQDDGPCRHLLLYRTVFMPLHYRPDTILSFRGELEHKNEADMVSMIEGPSENLLLNAILEYLVKEAREKKWSENDEILYYSDHPYARVACDELKKMGIKARLFQ